MDIAKAGSDCGDRIRVAFPKTKDHPSESFHCKRILSIGDYDRNDKGMIEPGDWAVFELDGSTSRKPVAFRRGGIDLMEPVNIYKMNPLNADHNKGNINVEIVRTDCLANSYNYSLPPFFIGPISALFNLDNCYPVLGRGNSGSAVLDLQGRLVGLLSFVIYDLSSTSKKSKYGAGTHGACIPLDEYHPPHECEYDKDKYFQLAFWYAFSLQKWSPDAKWIPDENSFPDLLNSIVEAHEENYRNSFSSVLRFSQTPRALSKDDIQIDLALSSDVKQFLSGMLTLAFPSFPECVEPGEGDSFTFLLSIMGREKQLIRFKRQNDIYWATLTDSSENTFDMYLLLGTEKNKFHFLVSICE